MFTAPVKYQMVDSTASALSIGGVVCLQSCPSEQTSDFSPKTTAGVRLKFVLTISCEINDFRG